MEAIVARLETKKLRSPRETSCNLADECYVTKRDIRASCVLRDDQRGLRPRMLQVRLRGLPACLPRQIRNGTRGNFKVSEGDYKFNPPDSEYTPRPSANLLFAALCPPPPSVR